MKNSRLVLGYCIFISILLVGNANAAITATVCNACGLAQLRQEAIDEGNGEHYLYDFVYGKITHYSISGTTPDSVGGVVTGSAVSSYITDDPITTEDQNIFSAVQNIYVQNNNSIYLSASQAISINVPQGESAYSYQAPSFLTPEATANGQMTAFEMVRVPVLRDEAIAQMQSPSVFASYTIALRSAVGVLLNAINATPLIHVPINQQVLLMFPDGSTSIVSFDFSTLTYSYVEGSSKDAVGNPIPETILEVTGGGGKNYLFPASSLGREAGTEQENNLRSMGIGITDEIYPTAWGIACVSSSVAEPVCTVYPEAQ